MSIDSMFLVFWTVSPLKKGKTALKAFKSSFTATKLVPDNPIADGSHYKTETTLC